MVAKWLGLLAVVLVLFCFSVVFWSAFEQHEESMNVLAIKYLNRLSDLLFILARHANREQGDVLWVPGGERS